MKLLIFILIAALSISVEAGCCSNNHKSCDASWCGRNKNACESCSNPGVIWLENGAKNNCLTRWSGCKNNPSGCCGGSCRAASNGYMQCLADSDWPPVEPQASDSEDSAPQESASEDTAPEDEIEQIEGGTYACDLPSNTHKFSVITKKNASIGAHNVYSSIAIGESFSDPKSGMDKVIGAQRQGTSYVKKLVGNIKFHWKNQRVDGASLSDAGIDFEHFEWLAQNAKSSNIQGKKVIVKTEGGTFNTYNFRNGGQGEDNGNTLVIFNTNQDIVLTKTNDGRQFGPSVIAPFSKVELLGDAGYMDGFVVAKSFATKGGNQGQLQIHGDTYTGSIACKPRETTPAPTPNPTRSPTSRPTRNPTPVPTSAPTERPTLVTTSSPTLNPTPMPSPEPTPLASGHPTIMASSNPTPVPTSVPTERPTPVPTSKPSSNPTLMPSPEPTPITSGHPTIMASSNPTSVPTERPTPVPTSKPTLNPTPMPSSEPTPHVSGHPTVMASSEPTKNPTLGPTALPTSSATPEVGTLEPFPTSSPTRPPTEATAAGDPHFRTWKQEHFEYHGQCDLMLAKDDGFADGLGFEVQIRTKLVRFWSYIKSAAIRIGDDILEVQGSVDPNEDGIQYWFNFEYRGDLKTIGGFPITLKQPALYKGGFEIDLSSKYPGLKILINHYKEFVKVDFQNGTEEAFGNAIGLLGNFKTGKTLARDGFTEIHDFSQFGNEWQVLPFEDMLFHDVEQPQFPKKCVEPEDPRGDRRRRLGESIISEGEAERACASIADPLDRKDCIYDILATQDIGMVGAY